jgi:hypothetical protein
MAIGDDFEIQGDGDIRHISGTSTYTVLELHRWLQGLADDAAAASDDFMDITVATPSERATDNIITLNAPFNIDDTAARFLYDGSITQINPVTVKQDIYAGLVVVGAVEAGTLVQIWQDEAILDLSWNDPMKNASAAASILTRILVKVKSNGAQIDGQKLIVWARELSDTYAEFAVTMTTGNNVAAIFTGPDLNNATAAGTISGWSDIVNTEGYQGLDISGDGSNEFYYSQWDNASRTPAQLYERTKWIQRRGSSEAIHSTTGPLFRGITHSFDYDGETTSPTEDAILAWGTSFAYNGGTGTVPAVGQYWENTTAGGFGKVVFVSSGAGATGTVVIQREGATPAWVTTNVFALRGGTGSITQNGAATAPITSLGGSARLLAKLDSGTTGTLWVQLLSGSIAGDNDPIWQRAGTTGAYVVANGAATVRVVSPEFFGTYTGSSIIGAYGIGILPGDGIAADLFTPLTGAAVNPPNNQILTVAGLISGEDRVLVTNNQASAVDYDQFTLNTTLSSGTETAVVLTTAIPNDTPASTAASGNQTYLRIQLDTGKYRQVAYTSWTGSTFQISSTDFTGVNVATQPRNVFITYIDVLADATSEAVSLKYSGDRTMFIRVRDGGASPIKTFETTVTFGSGGATVTAIRTGDT